MLFCKEMLMKYWLKTFQVSCTVALKCKTQRHASNYFKLRSATAKHNVEWQITQRQKAQQQNSDKTSDDACQ